MTEHEGGTDRQRLDALEKAIDGLVLDVSRLRAEAAALRAGIPAGERPAPAEAPKPSSAPTSSPPLIRPPAPGPRATTSRGVVSGGLEETIGRYGTLIVATFAILLGLGAFLQWAIARGLLGPEMRVALGAVGAVVLTFLGLRLRAKGSRTFGNALLAIALAVVHLVAWGAGPVLGIVPWGVALGFAALASMALAALALREGEEFLFILGLGGALLAPFVTTDGGGRTGQLLLFGGLVLSAAIVALRDPAWRIAPRLLSPFALGYVGSAAAGYREAEGVASAFRPAAFALALAVIAVGAGARGVRRGVAKGMLVLLVLGLLIADGRGDSLPYTAVTYAVLGLLVSHALRRRTAASEDGEEDTWVEVVGLPMLMLFGAIYGDDTWRETWAAWVSLLWIAITAVFMVLDDVRHRARHLSVMLYAAFIAMGVLHQDHALWRIAAYALVAAVGALTLHRVPGKSLLGPILLALAAATLNAYEAIDGRTRWEYTPFLNQVALASLTVAAAWMLFSFVARTAFAAMDAARKPFQAELPLPVALAVGPIALFLWIRFELAEAFSHDLATFLLISYYAVVGVGTSLVGRRREMDVLRQVGLALSLYAAGKAFVNAMDLDNVGLRIGSYLVVGVFVLGVGYLYRARTQEEAPAE